MKSDRFQCPSCGNLLQVKHELTPAPERRVNVIVWCGNVSRCPSERATNDGGSGPTEEAAYRALLLAVWHEEDNAKEPETVLSAEELHDKNAWAKADRHNDQTGFDGK